HEVGAEVEGEGDGVDPDRELPVVVVRVEVDLPGELQAEDRADETDEDEDGAEAGEEREDDEFLVLAEDVPAGLGQLEASREAVEHGWRLRGMGTALPSDSVKRREDCTTGAAGMAVQWKAETLSRLGGIPANRTLPVIEGP